MREERESCKNTLIRNTLAKLIAAALAVYGGATLWRQPCFVFHSVEPVNAVKHAVKHDSESIPEEPQERSSTIL